MLCISDQSEASSSIIVPSVSGGGDKTLRSDWPLLGIRPEIGLGILRGQMDLDIHCILLTDTTSY